MTEDQKAGVLVGNQLRNRLCAKNEDFRSFASDVAKQALNSNAADIDAFMNEAWQGDAGKTVKDVQTEKIAVIGENINVRRFEKVNADGCVANTFMVAVKLAS